MTEAPYGLPDEVLEGMTLSSDEARQLEQSVSGRVAQSAAYLGTPRAEDVEARLRLLGYYLLASVASGDAAFLAARHVVWLIANVPETTVLGTALGVPMNEAFAAEAGRLWRAHIDTQPRNATVLMHAARFFSQIDRPYAEHLRYRLQNLDPVRFAEFSIDFDAPKEPAPRGEEPTIAELEDDVVHAENDEERAAALVQLSKRAWHARDLDTAWTKAEAALDAARAAAHGAHAHTAETLLGLVGLERGDVEEARRRLVASTQVPRSPALQSFGPDMTLARAFLDRGQRDEVLDYFEHCRDLWDMGHALLDAWSVDVAEGRMPNFLGNCRIG